MVPDTRPQHSSVIYLTLLVAVLLMLIPLPDILRYARPEWVVMTLIYWAMALPNRVSIGVAWFSGLLMDIVSGEQLGLQAFSYALAIYLVSRFHLQLRQYPLWQQAFIILSLVFLVHLISVINAHSVSGWHFWMPAVSSTLFWPITYTLLKTVRRKFEVS